MTKWKNQLVLFLALSFGLLPLAACTEQTPVERVAALRSHYTGELNSFLLLKDPEPVAEEATAEDSGAEELEPMEPAPGTEAAESEEELVMEGPKLHRILLDYTIRHDSKQKLDGITLDLTHVDARRAEKGHWRFWVDTSALERGFGEQLNYTLEEVDYVEGDAFSIEVVHPVPETDRNEYREFSNL